MRESAHEEGGGQRERMFKHTPPGARPDAGLDPVAHEIVLRLFLLL